MSKFKVGDKVRILDGSKTEDYTGSWASCMGKFVGKVVTVECPVQFCDKTGYRVKEVDYLFDERYLEPTTENETIVIYRKGQEVIALDKRTGKKAVAKCSPEDEFDFKVGAELALKRLMVEPPKFKIGDFVVANKKADEHYGETREGWRGVVVDADVYDSDSSENFIKVESLKDDVRFVVKAECFDLSEAGYSGKVVCTAVYAAYDGSFTLGKIYTIKNGIIKDDRGTCRPYRKDGYIKSISDKLLCKYGGFIELVE